MTRRSTITPPRTYSGANHDRRDWIAAGELEIGEELNGLVIACGWSPRHRSAAPPRVYNLEVHGEHVYRVATRECWYIIRMTGSKDFLAEIRFQKKFAKH